MCIRDRVEGVRVIAYANVPGRIAASASLLYAKNLYTFLETMVDKAGKQLAIKRDDELVKATMLTDDSGVVHASFAHLKPTADASQPAAATASEGDR